MERAAAAPHHACSQGAVAVPQPAPVTSEPLTEFLNATGLVQVPSTCILNPLTALLNVTLPLTSPSTVKVAGSLTALPNVISPRTDPCEVGAFLCEQRALKTVLCAQAASANPLWARAYRRERREDVFNAPRRAFCLVLSVCQDGESRANEMHG